MENPNQLINELKQFTCTEHFYENPLFPLFVYTDGVKYLAEQADAYWLIDYIFSSQIYPKIAKELFQVWKIKVNDNKANIQVEDGDDNIIQEFKLNFTDFPLAEFTLWFTDRTLLLKSEY